MPIALSLSTISNVIERGNFNASQSITSGPAMSRFHSIAVAKVDHQTRDTIVVSFDVPADLRDTFHFVQGQHLTLRTDIDGHDVRRSYSICSAVQDRDLRIAIKRSPGGVFSNWANDHMKRGMSIAVMPPMGHFNTPLQAEQSRHYLGFAAGSGITPLLSIIKTTLLAEPMSRFTLLYGNRATSSVIFREELADLKDTYLERFKLVYVMSREQQDIELFNGRITAEKCEALFQHWINLDDVDLAFICGPEQMMHAVAATLEKHGMPKEKIKIELFAASIPKHEHHPRPASVLGTGLCEVTVIMDGRSASFAMEKDKESVLDAGLRQGLDLRYACKGGVCATCRCKVVEGEVEMDANHALEDYEIARGFVLSCQSFPVTEKLVVDFDQDT
ncbi:MAG: phenylacetic acid degradation protein [Herminiimonas sp.]|nr:phenylacetic acid degradation protein [Herminiimonas sp.]